MGGVYSVTVNGFSSLSIHKSMLCSICPKLLPTPQNFVLQAFVSDATICKQKRLVPLLDGCFCCADIFVLYCRIDIFHCCLEIIIGHGLDPSNLEFDPPPQEKVAEVSIRGMQRPSDFQESQQDFFSFEQVQDG